MPIYGCHNKPRPVIGSRLVVQDGYGYGAMFNNDRIARMVEIPFVMSEACQYTKMHATDKLCAGCIHQHKE